MNKYLYPNARTGRLVSRQRIEQLRHPERFRARQAVANAVKSGVLPKPSDLPCVDCGARAREYDHARGYEGDAALDVDAVCRNCHQLRARRSRGASIAVRLLPSNIADLEQIIKSGAKNASEAIRVALYEAAEKRRVS